MKRPLLIAEVKTKSPFGYESAKTWEEQFKFANTHGDILSIHTDVRWGGSFELLSKARTLTDKPILAKGIHADDTQIERAVACGAEYVLVVGRIPKVHLDKCLIEVNSLAELEKIPAGVKAVWNNRDLNTGGVKKETCKQARKLLASTYISK